MQRETLDKLAERIRQDQLRQTANQAPLPELYVDRDGTIGHTDQQGETTRLSRLTTEPMYAPTTAGNTRWLARQRQIVKDKLPGNAVEIHQNGRLGFGYTIADEFGFQYTLWAGYDALQGIWFAHLVDPPREALRAPGAPPPTAHDVHLFDDGVICLNREIGYRDLERLYARTAMWARGASCYRTGHGFAFSVG